MRERLGVMRHVATHIRVSHKQSRVKATQRNQPGRILESNFCRRGPKLLLIAQEISYELGRADRGRSSDRQPGGRRLCVVLFWCLFDLVHLLTALRSPGFWLLCLSVFRQGQRSEERRVGKECRSR